MSGILLIHCLCNAEAETTSHYLEQKTKLFESLCNLDKTLLNHCDDDLVNILLNGSSKYSFAANYKMLSLSVEFSESAKRFDKLLF